MCLLCISIEELYIFVLCNCEFKNKLCLFEQKEIWMFKVEFVFEIEHNACDCIFVTIVCLVYLLKVFLEATLQSKKRISTENVDFTKDCRHRVGGMFV
jgi:hypothetical protein